MESDKLRHRQNMLLYRIAELTDKAEEIQDLLYQNVQEGNQQGVNSLAKLMKLNSINISSYCEQLSQSSRTSLYCEKQTDIFKRDDKTGVLVRAGDLLWN